jgi:hypothetical protein
MEINGQVAINGDFTVDSQGNQDSINYTGRAAVLVQGDADLDVNLLSVNANGTIENSYPASNCFGLMASGQLTVGSGAQRSLMGAMYAEQRINSVKQTHMVGTYVSDYFDMGTNVPNIYQCPALPANLPYGMVGAYPVWIVAQRCWIEL